MQSIVLLCAHEAFVGARPIYEAAKNDETLIVNLGKGVIIPWLWDVSGLLELGPGLLHHVEFVNLLYIVDARHAAVDNHLVAEHRRLVVGDLSGQCALLFDWLPLDPIGWVILQLFDSRHAKLPHVFHGPLFDVPAAVNIQVVIHDEAAVVRSPFGKLPS